MQGIRTIKRGLEDVNGCVEKISVSFSHTANRVQSVEAAVQDLQSLLQNTNAGSLDEALSFDNSILVNLERVLAASGAAASIAQFAGVNTSTVKSIFGTAASGVTALGRALTSNPAVLALLGGGAGGAAVGALGGAAGTAMAAGAGGTMLAAAAALDAVVEDGDEVLRSLTSGRALEQAQRLAAEAEALKASLPAATPLRGPGGSAELAALRDLQRRFAETRLSVIPDVGGALQLEAVSWTPGCAARRGSSSP